MIEWPSWRELDACRQLLVGSCVEVVVLRARTFRQRLDGSEVVMRFSSWE